MRVESLSCLKSKYLLFFSARWFLATQGKCNLDRFNGNEFEGREGWNEANLVAAG